MAHAKKQAKARTSRKKALHDQDRHYQPPNRLPMSKATAPEFRPKPSRMYHDLHAQDERQLATIVLTIMIGGFTLIALHYSGTFDWFISLFE